MFKKKYIWEQITENFKSKLSKSEFETWFTQTSIKEINSDLIIIEVPNKFHAKWLSDKYLSEIKKNLKKILKKTPEIRFSSQQKLASSEKPAESNQKRESDFYLKQNLNTSMTFDSFLRWDYNRFARSSSFEIADKPNNNYNPLYIYSELSLGKTHLLHAIGNHIKSKNPLYNIKYLSSDSFTNDLTYSIKKNILHEFRERYLNMDIFLFDDIHLLANRKKTQDEFQFIFNSLYNSKKRIVITGKMPPNRLKNINSQLLSRLGWGLLTEIKVPDQKTKIEIINKKAKENDIHIPDDVIFFLAKINNNIKALFKNIIRLETYSSLNNGDINISMIRSFINDKNKIEIGIENIKSLISGYFNISVSDLISKRRKRAYSYPRQMAMYLCRKHTTLSLREIGNSFGYKDHSTVIYAIRRIEKGNEEKKEIEDDLIYLENILT